MGTNYTWVESVDVACPHCGRAYDEPKMVDRRRHIGKSSGGWYFALHVYPDEGIRDLADWADVFASGKGHIENEYGNVLSTTEMIASIMNRSGGKSASLPSYDWLRRNYAEIASGGLVRSVVDGKRCIGHGEGTWDLFVGDFS